MCMDTDSNIIHIIISMSFDGFMSCRKYSMQRLYCCWPGMGEANALFINSTIIDIFVDPKLYFRSANFSHIGSSENPQISMCHSLTKYKIDKVT